MSTQTDTEQREKYFFDLDQGVCTYIWEMVGRNERDYYPTHRMAIALTLLDLADLE